jgi:hypothetical protein
MGTAKIFFERQEAMPDHQQPAILAAPAGEIVRLIHTSQVQTRPITDFLSGNRCSPSPSAVRVWKVFGLG